MRCHFAPRKVLQLAVQLPSLLRLTTYGESYHENHATRRFEDGLYPGGWSDLVSYQTAEFALGTAARPYVNAGHSAPLTRAMPKSSRRRLAASLS